MDALRAATKPKRQFSLLGNTVAAARHNMRVKNAMADSAENDRLVNDRLADVVNAELARSLMSDASPDKVQATVEAKIEESFHDVLGPQIDEIGGQIQKLEAERNDGRGRLLQSEPSVAHERGRQDAFSKHVVAPNRTVLFGVRAVAVLVSLLEVALLHRPVTAAILTKIPVGWLQDPPGSLLATLAIVLVANGLTWMVAHLGGAYLHRRRVADLEDTEPPPRSELIGVQGGFILVLVMQVLLVYVRFAGDDTGQTDRVLSTISVIAVLAVLGVALIEADKTGTPALWDNRVLDGYRKLHQYTHDNIPRAVYVLEGRLHAERIRHLDRVIGLLVPAYSPAAAAYKASVKPPTEPVYQFSWPDPVAPQRGRWGRQTSPGTDGMDASGTG